MLYTLDVRGESGVPSFNIWLFFFYVIWSNSSFEPFIYSLCDICLMWMYWLLDSDAVLAFDVQFLLLVPILATTSEENFPLSPFQLLQILHRAYLLCLANDIAKLFTNALQNYDKGKAR